MTKMLIIFVLFLAICIITFFSVKCSEHYENTTNVSLNLPKKSEDTAPQLLSDNKDTLQTEVSSQQTNVDPANKCDIIQCDVNKCGRQLYPIMNPEFNMREVAKQCLLLEDHLNNKKKRCLDCIRKHFFIIEGLLEEAISLEKVTEERDAYRTLFTSWTAIEKQYARKSDDGQNIDDVSKQIRLFRKPLVEKYFDQISSYDDT